MRRSNPLPFLNLPHRLRRIPLSIRAHIPLKLPRRQPRLKHLVNLLQRPVSSLGQEEVRKHHADHVAPKPDVAVLGAPAEFCGIDEVGGAEGPGPVAEEIEGGGEAEGEGAELVVDVFTS
jgi:hypothetical protein